MTGLFQFISTTFIHFKILAMKVNLFRFLLILMVFNGACQSEQSFKILQAPAENLQCKVDLGGQTVIPNGRFLTPVGKSILVAPHPYGLAISNDGNIAVTANSGINPLSVSIIKNLKTENPQILQIPPGPFTDKGILASVFMGIAISPDKRVVYVSGGQENKIYIFNIQTGVKEGVIDCSVSAQGEFYEDGYIGDLTISSDGNWIFAVDQIQFRMLIINTSTKEVVRNVGVGRYPFGIALSPDEKKVYVANVGMFEYKPIRFKSKSDTGLTFPPFGFGTEVSKTGYSNDSVEVPGLGDSNVTESFSVWAVDVSDINSARVIAKIKTGHLVGDLIEGIPAVGGSSPNSLVATDQFVFVSNGNNDNITVIDIANDTILAEIYLHPIDAFRNFRGVIPFGLAVSPDQKRLYVAESGINAIGVIDIPALKVIGHIPTGWFPSKLKVTPDGKRIVVANAKGFGSGPNGGKDFKPGDEGTYIGSLMKGSVQVFDIPDDADLPQLTEKVVSNNFKIHVLEV